MEGLLSNLSSEAQKLVKDACVATGRARRDARRDAKRMVKKRKFREEFQFGTIGGMRTLNFAISGNHQVFIEILLDIFNVDPGVTDDVTSLTPLHHAAKLGRLDVIDTLVRQHHCQLDPLDSCGSTPLYLSLLETKQDSVNLLVDLGSSVEVCGLYGLPMHHAAFNNCCQALRKLHDTNADVIDMELYGFCSPIVAALCAGHRAGGPTESLLFLAQSKSLDGKPLVYKAIVSSTSEDHASGTLRILLANGLNPNLVDKSLCEENAVLCAAKRGWRDVIATLLPRVDPIPGIDWTTDGVLTYVASDSFRFTDTESIQTRITILKERMVQEMMDKHFLASYYLLTVLCGDIGEETWKGYKSLQCIMEGYATASDPMDCDAMNLHFLGMAACNAGNFESALSAAEACLVLEPDNPMYRNFYTEVMKASSGPSSSNRRS